MWKIRSGSKALAADSIYCPAGVEGVAYSPDILMPHESETSSDGSEASCLLKESQRSGVTRATSRSSRRRAPERATTTVDSFVVQIFKILEILSVQSSLTSARDVHPVRLSYVLTRLPGKPFGNLLKILVLHAAKVLPSGTT